MKAQEIWNQNKHNWSRLSLDDGGVPLLLSFEDFICILGMCRTDKTREDALRLHTYLCTLGLETHTLLGNRLVSIMVDIGSMSLAQQYFDRLVWPAEEPWNFLISGYIKCGELKHALTLYKNVDKGNSLHLSGYTVVALLKAAAKLNDLDTGCQLHHNVSKEGLLQRDAFVGSSLIYMYAKCGQLTKAEEVFEKVLVRDRVSWNTLIAGYAEYGHGEEALSCFQRMQKEVISLDAVTLVCVLKACGTMMTIDMSQKIHTEILFLGLDEDCFISNTLVDVYAKFHLLVDAQWVFQKLPVRDVVSWNALIAGLAIHGCGTEALHYFEQMQQEGIPPQAVTFVLSLKACGIVGTTSKGQQIHSQVAKTGLLETNMFVGSAMVDMYANCGIVSKAQEVFDLLPVQNVVSWNALIAGYVENEYAKEALDCFEQMQYEGISPNDVTFVNSLKACAISGDLVKGQEIHAKATKKGLEGELRISSVLVDMYARCCLLVDAHQTFDKFSGGDAISWTALMAGYEEHKYAEEALRCFENMQHEGGPVTFVCALKACTGLRVLSRGQEIHAESARKGLLEKDMLVGSTLVDMYAKCGLLATAREVFDKLPYSDIVAWTALIAGYVEHGNNEEALSCFEQMQRAGISMDAFSLVCSLKACSSIGAAVKGQKIHMQSTKIGLEGELLVGSTLVELYAKCGWLVEAHNVFDKLLAGDVVLWTALIAGYADFGDTENALHTFHRMREVGIKPDQITFVSVLNACSHGGRVDEGQMYFRTMCNEGLISNFEHHGCLVDLLCRAGQLYKAMSLMNKMPFHPNAVVWRSVFSRVGK